MGTGSTRRLAQAGQRNGNANPAYLTRYGNTGEGDVKMLTDRDGLYRLRVGKWRLFFDLVSPDTVRIHGIDNRGQAY